MVGPDGIKPNMEKMVAVAKWPAPQDVQDLMVFIVLTNYCPRLSCDYVQIAQLLMDFMRNLKIDISKFASRKGRKGA